MSIRSTPKSFSVDRRHLLVSLAGIIPAVQFGFPSNALAAPSDDVFLRISRIITGTDALSAEVAQRIRDLLSARDAAFAAKLGDLADVIQQTNGSRDEMLKHLSEAQVEFALSIAKPWYLGYVGKPSSFVLKDDAAFATFLEAQSFQKIIDFVPRPTYPDGSAGFWADAPTGVDLPAMPEQIKNWTFHPGGPAAILAPDPRWKMYATAEHASVEEARTKKPQAANSAAHG